MYLQVRLEPQDVVRKADQHRLSCTSLAMHLISGVYISSTHAHIHVHLCIHTCICLCSAKCCPSQLARSCVASGMRTSVVTGDPHLCFCCFSSHASDVSPKMGDADSVRLAMPSRLPFAFVIHQCLCAYTTIYICPRIRTRYG